MYSNAKSLSAFSFASNDHLFPTHGANEDLFPVQGTKLPLLPIIGAEISEVHGVNILMCPLENRACLRAVGIGALKAALVHQRSTLKSSLPLQLSDERLDLDLS